MGRDGTIPEMQVPGSDNPNDRSPAPLDERTALPGELREAPRELPGGGNRAMDRTANPWAETLLDAEESVLCMIAEARPLEHVLKGICRMVESACPEAICAVLRTEAEGGRLHWAAASNPPARYRDWVEAMSSKSGPPGAGPGSLEPRISADIASDPPWANYRQQALDAGLRACWAVPIQSPSGESLGSLSTFLPISRRPSDDEWRVCRRAAHLASIAIERHIRQQALRVEEERLRIALEAGSMETWDWDIQTGTMTWSRGQASTYDLAPSPISVSFETFLSSVHPEDRGKVTQFLTERVEQAIEHRIEYRHLSPGGSVRWVEGRGRLVLDESGKPVGMLGVRVDITERKRTEERLRQQRERFRVTLTSMGDAVITTDPAGRILFMNPVAEALTGWKSGEAFGKVLDEVFRVVHEPARVASQNPIERVLREGPVVGQTDHAVLISRDGFEHPIDHSGAPIRDRAGQVVGVVLVFRDVDERRRAEQALMESERRLRQLADTMPQIVWTADFDGAVDYFNGRWYEYTGMTPDASLAAEGWRNAIHPDDVASLFEVRNLAVGKGQLFETEVRLHDQHGRYRWHLIRSLPVSDESGQVARRFGTATDIHDRKKVEETLRANEQRFRLLTEAMPQLVWSSQPDGGIDYVNRRWVDFTGLSPELTLGDGWTSVLHPDDQEDTLHAWKRATATGELYQQEQRLRRKDGAYRWFLTRAVPLRSEDGTVLKWYGTCTDITEQKQAREILRESEARFRQLADAMPQIVWTAEPDGTLEYLNRRFFEYAGLDPENCPPLNSLVEYIHPQDRERVKGEGAKAHVTNGILEVEFRLRDRTGVYRWQLGRSVPVLDASGRVVRRFGTATDIDDRKRAEYDARFLAEASATLSSPLDENRALEHVAQLAVPFFADWCVVDMVAEDGALNRLVIAHVDPSKVEVILELERRFPTTPDSPHGVYQVIRSGRSDMIPDITDAMLERGSLNPEHLRLLRALGPRSHLCVPVTGTSGTIGAIAFGLSESGRRFEPKDRRLAEDLARRAAIAIDNARLYAELKRADQRKDEFLATLAHELRNPLAPIRNALHLLERPEFEESTRDEVRAVVKRQVDHMTRLVEDLLDVSRITRGSVELRKEVIDLATVINRSVEASRPLMGDQGHVLAVTLSDEPILLEADPTRLEQIFDNLLNNAAKYTDPGGQISISAERRGEFAEVRVRDTGIGIDPEQLPKIFDLFMQAERRLDRSQGGLGIGLSLVRSLIEMHGGSVSVHSEGLGRGTEFVVRLPIFAGSLEVKQEAPPKSRRAAPRALPKRKVLVVDDNLDAARTMAMLLKRAWGQDVEVVHDGLAAVQAAHSFRPDVVLLDIGLPGLNGYEVARRLRERSEFDQTYIVAMTGWGQEEDRKKSKDAGFDRHLVKPVDPEELRSVLREAIK